jgi:uncharacterized ion transporter superfamily protein YfcC
LTLLRLKLHIIEQQEKLVGISVCLSPSGESCIYTINYCEKVKNNKTRKILILERINLKMSNNNFKKFRTNE